MNLTHGKVYRVKIFTDTLPFSRKTHIWVVWKPDPEPNAVHETAVFLSLCFCKRYGKELETTGEGR